jgi:hypothetical protein
MAISRRGGGVSAWLPIKKTMRLNKYGVLIDCVE